MSDEFQNWRDALAGKEVALHADIPSPGYYKLRAAKDGPWLPVAIWTKDGVLTARVGPDTKDPFDIWTRCAKTPVKKDDAKQAFATGAWPGDVTIGHNSGDLSLADEIKDAIGQVLEWLAATGVTDKTSMDRAANYRARLIDLAKKADAERDGKVRPHLDAQREINAEYKPLVDSAKATADTVRDALSRYMAAEQEKARAAAAEAARVENERRLAEHKRQQEEAARIAASRPAQAKINDPLPPPIEEPVMVAPEPAVKLQAGGQRGKKVSLREFTKHRVDDYRLALAHAQDHPDVRAAVEKVCFAQARAGATVPGVSSYIEQVAV
jgi:hypothetical protein